jgi:hypothetical protein
MPAIEELLAVVDAAIQSNEFASDLNEDQSPFPFHVIQAGLLGEAVVVASEAGNKQNAALSTMTYGAASLPSFSELDREYLENTHLR